MCNTSAIKREVTVVDRQMPTLRQMETQTDLHWQVTDFLYHFFDISDAEFLSSLCTKV